MQYMYPHHVFLFAPMVGGLCPKLKFFGGVGGLFPKTKRLSAGGLCAKMKRLSGGGRVPQDAVVFIAF